jgi:hypothetical protein
MEPNMQQKPYQFINTKLNNIERQLSLINEGFIGFWLDRENKELNYIRFDNALAY